MRPVLLWIARGISRPVLTSGCNMAVNANRYVSNCLELMLIPFLNTYYPRGGYIFWPDKASAHYAATTTSFLDSKGVNYVRKEDNPTEVLQCRPVEDFFGLLATRVYLEN